MKFTLAASCIALLAGSALAAPAAELARRQKTIVIGGPALSVGGNAEGGNANGGGSNGATVTIPKDVADKLPKIKNVEDTVDEAASLIPRDPETIAIGGPAISIGGKAKSGKATGGDSNFNLPSINI